MKNTIILLVLALVLSFAISEDKIGLELQKKMQQVRSQQLIPITVLFTGMPTFADVAQEYRFLGDSEVINDQVMRVMKDRAESLHYSLQEMCNSYSRSNEMSNFRSIWIANAVSMKATPASIQEIAMLADVEKIVLDEPVKMLLEDRGYAWGVEKIKAPSVWNSYDGTGVTVAVADTGVNAHGDLAGRVFDGQNYITPGTAPRDDHGHGTHCAGSVAGNGAMGTQTGVAPKANIVAIKVLSSSGSGAWSNLYLAIEEAVQCNPKPKVISMSLGGTPDDATRTRLRQSCKTAIDFGLIPVIAAGNSGSSASTIISPGDVPEVITVGATSSTDAIASFSSRGPTKAWDGVTYVKPDVSAPGVSIVSCSYNSNGYTTMSGTSMATPHVAGLVALMVQAKPTLNTELAKAALEATALDLGTAGKDNTFGAGRVQADKAVTAALSLANVGRSDRFEMVVKELTFTTTVDVNGMLNITEVIDNDLMPATVTIWANIPETEARKGVYKVKYSLQGPNGLTEAVVSINFDNIPTDPNQYDAKYGFNCGNFALVKGQYTGRVVSVEPNTQVQNVKITLAGKATWPARK